MKFTAIVVFLLSVFLFISPVKSATDATAKQKAILVTGASSGIGKSIALKLASEGHFVYAGARKTADIKSLSAIKNVKGLRLDVTVQADIDAAVDTIRKQRRGLYGLVNNAGVAIFTPLIETSEKDMQFIMDVNLFGPYRITKAFAPLIIESEGRITTTGSLAGTLAGQLFGPYSMSKHAMEAFTDSLGQEMKKFNVQVSIVQPGNFNSKIIENMRRRIGKNPQTKSLRYQKEIDNFIAAWPEDRSHHKNPDAVADAVMHAMFADSPKRRYMVVPSQREAGFTLQKALTRVAEMNAHHDFSYSKDVLGKMLDEAISNSEKNWSPLKLKPSAQLKNKSDI